MPHKQSYCYICSNCIHSNICSSFHLLDRKSDCQIIVKICRNHQRFSLCLRPRQDHQLWLWRHAMERQILNQKIRQSRWKGQQITQAFLFDTFSSFFKFQVSGWGMFFEFQTWVFSKLTWGFWKFGHKKGGKGIFRPILELFFCGWGMFLPFLDLSFSKRAEFCQNPEFLLGLSFSQNVKKKKAWITICTHNGN